MVDIPLLETSLNAMVDWVVSSDDAKMLQHINRLQRDNPWVTERVLANKVISEQSFKSGFLGGLTGFGGLITLPATIPIDIVKAWKIQAYTVKCISHIYGYTSEPEARKTDIFLLLSSGSIEEIQKLINKQAHDILVSKGLGYAGKVKDKIARQVAGSVPKYVAKGVVSVGGKKVAGYVMSGFSKHLVRALWGVGGKKIVQRSIQKSIGKAVPVIGAVLGAGMDYAMTQAVGKVAIDYYENNTPEYIESLFDSIVLDFQQLESYLSSDEMMSDWDARFAQS